MLVGIPRGLLYHEYGELWKLWLEGLGHKVLVSEPTNKAILDAGVQSAPEEACLPVKAFFGHVRHLAGKVNALFIPRVVKPAPRQYSCPKLIGLPDMIRSSLQGVPRLLVYEMHAAPSAIGSVISAAQWGFELCGERSRALASYLRAVHKWKSATLPTGNRRKRPTVAIVGHKYLISDSFLCRDIPQKVKALGVDVVSAPSACSRLEWEFCTKPIYWDFERTLVRETLEFLSGGTDGVIHISSFGCGPDSMIAELLHRWAEKRAKVPFVTITVDEHTADAGLLTRLEAFVDMMEANRSHEANLPSHWEHAHTFEAFPEATGSRGHMSPTIH